MLRTAHLLESGLVFSSNRTCCASSPWRWSSAYHKPTAPLRRCYAPPPPSKCLAVGWLPTCQKRKCSTSALVLAWQHASSCFYATLWCKFVICFLILDEADSSDDNENEEQTKEENEKESDMDVNEVMTDHLEKTTTKEALKGRKRKRKIQVIYSHSTHWRVLWQADSSVRLVCDRTACG